MSAIDLESLLKAISDDEPCGPDPLENGEYAGFKILAEEVDPSWALVKQQAINLFDQHNDLSLGLYLTLALMNRDGITGFSEGLELMASLLDQYWDTLYPLTDEDDGRLLRIEPR